MELQILDLKGKPAGTISLDDQRWGGPTNLPLLNQVVRMYRANQRAGTASTKTRGDVSGGGKKPWKQKHTGRARAGSIRSPLWRHGGIVFGPHPRDFGYSLPKAIRRKALFESLKGKIKDQELVVVSQIHATEPKTKPFAKLADTFKVSGTSIIVLDEFLDPVVKSLRNLAHFELRRADDLNAFDVINSHKVLLTKAAFDRVEQRFGETSPSTVTESAPEKSPAKPKPSARKPAGAKPSKPSRGAARRTAKASAKKPVRRSTKKKGT